MIGIGPEGIPDAPLVLPGSCGAISDVQISPNSLARSDAFIPVTTTNVKRPIYC